MAGYLHDLNLQLDLAGLAGSTAGYYLVGLSPNGCVRLETVLTEGQMLMTDWLTLGLTIGINDHPSNISGAVAARCVGAVTAGLHKVKSYTVDNLAFSGIIAPPPSE